MWPKDYKNHILPDKCDETELIRKFQNRRTPSPLQDKHSEISLLQHISPSLIRTPVRASGLEDIREEENDSDTAKSTHNPTTYSSFTLPSHTTPPARQTLIRNPFEAALIKKLHLPIYSPSVFKKVVSPSQDTHQFWSIDAVAQIKPASIEEFNIQQCEAIDPETEREAQQAIDHFFHNTHIAPSPWGPQPASETSSPYEDKENNQTPSFSISSVKKEVSVQTMLSLPPQLPPALEAALEPYFITNQDQIDGGEEINLSTSTLRRKLFDHNDDYENMSFSPVRACFPVKVECKPNSPAYSGHLCTSTKDFCPASPVIKGRNDDTPISGSKFEITTPEISPVGIEHDRNKSVTRLSFSTRLLTFEKSCLGSSLSPL
ncbi:hypothetical protein L9F63_000182, partial [Diploptera punctata]